MRHPEYSGDAFLFLECLTKFLAILRILRRNNIMHLRTYALRC